MEFLIKKTLLLFIALLSWTAIQANHISGANIEYECLGGGSYRVTLNVFQDCEDITVAPTQNLRAVPDCNFGFFSFSLPLISNVEVSQLCSSLILQSECNGGLLPGKRHLMYQGLVNIPSTCPEYRILWKFNYRTPTTNVSGTQSFYVHAIIRPQEGCNSSPQITIQQLPYVCAGQAINYNFGALDIESDSLVYSYTNSLSSDGGNGFVSVVYEPGFSGIAPIPGCTINSETGVLSFIAPAIGEYTITIQVEQYNDAGVFVGSISIDVNIVADFCPNPPPELVINALQNFSGNATLTGPHTIEMCYGEFFCADILFNSSVPIADIQVISNIQTVLPGATLTYTGGNPSTATVCWEANQFGLDGTIVLIADDDLCPLPGIVSFSFNVDVKPGVYAGPNRIICPGEAEQLQALGDSDFNWEVYQGEPMVIGTNFSCNPCSNPIASPNSTTTYIVTGIDPAAECFYKDTLTLTVALDLNTLVTDVGCIGNEGAIALEILSGSGDYSLEFEGVQYELTSNLFDSIGLSPGTYEIIVTDDIAGCSVTLNETVGALTIPIPDAGVGPAQPFCASTYALQASSTGGSLFWTGTGPGIVSFSPNETTEDATVTVDTAGSYWFYLSESDGFCAKTDSVQIIFLGDINANAGANITVCGTQTVLSASQNYGTGTWLSVPAGAAFSGGASNPNPSVTVPGTGTYTFFWQVNGGNSCADADDVQIIFKPYPTALAGADHTSCLTTDTLSATATNGTGTWTWPAGVSVNNAIDPNAAVTLTGSPGIYTLTWTVSNGTCSTFDEIDIEFEFVPNSNAGFDQSNVCGLSTVLAANGSIGLWSGPSGISFADATDPLSSLAVTAGGAYTLTWTLGTGICASIDDVIILFQEIPEANAGTDLSVCSADLILGATPSVGTGQWTLPAGVTISDISDPNASLSTLTYGTYILTWTETNGTACTNADQVEVSFIQQPSTNAGNDQSVCGLTATLAALPSVGNGIWIGPAQVSFDDLNSPTAQMTSSAYGSYTLTWTEENGNGCISTDQVIINFIENPIADAGPDTALCSPSYSLQANPSIGAGTWTIPAGLNPSDLSDPNCILTADAFGIYILTWSEDNGNGCSSSDQVELVFVEQPMAFAGNDTILCGNQFMLNAIPTVGSGTWNLEPGLIFSDVNAPSSTINALVYGSYSLTWTEDNGNGCSSSDQVMVQFTEQPDSEAGSDMSSCDEDIDLNAIQGAGTGIWTGPSNINFLDATDPTTSISSSANGSFTLYWTVTNGSCTSVDSLLATYSDPPVADAGTYSPFCGNTATLSASFTSGTGHWIFPAGISGDENDPNAEITALASGTYSLEWIIIIGQCSDTAQVSITFLSLPIAEAGPSISICGNSAFLSADPALGTGQWSFPSGITGNVNVPNPMISTSSYGSFTMYWNVTDASGCVAVDSVSLAFIQNPSPAAGEDFQLCGNQGTLNAAPSFGIGSWIDQSGISIDNLSNPQASITASPGVYTLIWSEVNEGFCSAQDTVMVTFTAQPQATLTSSNESICGNSASVQAAFSVPGSTGIWTGSSALTFSNPTAINSTVTSSGYGPKIILWIENNAGCVDTAQVVMTFFQVPQVEAGNPQSMCGLSMALQGSISVGEGIWTGPGVTFGLPELPTSMVTASAFGTYILTWTAENGPCQVQDQVEVTFLNSPISNAGSDQQICGLQAQTAALPSTGIGTWTFPTGVSMSNVNDPLAPFSNSNYGPITLTWTEDNGTCAASDQVTYTYFQMPNANAGSDIDDCGLVGILSAIPSIGNGTWSGPPNIGFANATNPNTSFNSSISGNFSLIWTEVNGVCSDQESLGLQLTPEPLANAGQDATQCGTSYTLQALPSTGTGSWNGGPGVSFIPSPNVPGATAMVTGPGSYTFTWTEDNGLCSDQDLVNVEFNDSPDTSSTQVICLNANTQYQVIIQIINGEASSYEVTGSQGNLSGSVFNSGIFNVQDSYSFLISDAHNCGSISIAGTAFCPSLSNAGILDLDTLHACPSESAEASVLSSAFLDPNDVQAFFLHEQANGLGTIWASSENPLFSFQAGMTLGQVYFISSVAGNDDGTGLPDLTSPGTDFSLAVPVIFHANPEISALPLIAEHCPGEPAIIYFNIEGIPSFELTYLQDGILQTSGYNTTGPQTLVLDATQMVIWLELSDAYCAAESNQISTIYVLPTPSMTAQDSLIFCNGATENIELQFEGSGPYELTWQVNFLEPVNLTSAQDVLPFSPSASGDYVFYNLSDAVCGSTDSVLVYVDIIPLPLADAGPDQTICEGESVQLGTSGLPDHLYTWNNNGFLDDTSSSQPQGIFNEIGAESLVVTFNLEVSAFGCSNIDEVVVIVNPLPFDTGISGADKVCLGLNTMLTATGGAAYIWANLGSDSLSNPITITPSTDATYIVQIFTEFGCSVSESFSIEVLALPEVDLLADSYAGCPPMEVAVMNLVQVPASSSCEWSINAGTLSDSDCDLASAELSIPGNYVVSLSITDSFGCIGTALTDTIRVNETIAAFHMYPDVLTMDDAQVQVFGTSNNIAQWIWFFEGEVVAQGVSPIISLDVPRPDYYELCLAIIGNNGCADTLCKDFEILNNVKVWVPNSFSPDGNGLNEGFHAVVDGAEYISNYSLHVFDRRGLMVFDSNTWTEPWKGESMREKDTMQGVYQWHLMMSVFGESYPREYRGTVTILR